MDILDKFTLILGSSSPRRKQILEEAGIPFVQRVIEVEESYPSDMPPEEVPAYIALKKATPFMIDLKEKDILLTSDCLVVCDNIIMGKPGNYKEATSMLNFLSGKTHEVMTGVCLTHLKSQHTFTTKSLVHFNPLSEEEIHYYINNFKPFDKAGGYAIQEWIGHCKISGIEGSYLNIVGLPMEAVYENLKRFILNISE